VADDSRLTGEDQDVRKRLIREIDWARARIAALERQLARKVPSIDLAGVEVDPAFVEIIPTELARKHRVLPLFVSRVFTVAMADPSDQLAIDEIEALTGFLVQPVAATEPALEDALDQYYGPPGSSGGTTRAATRARLRLVWPRKRSSREDAGGGPAGGRPAA
jgi:hypothetical protein